MNPEFRATLSSLQRNIESANETAAENFYTFTQLVIDPCLGGITACFSDLTSTCFPSRDDRLRRKRARSRGRSDLHFDFYDDWEQDEAQNVASWGDDELDSLLAGSRQPRSKNNQPSRTRGMSYGTNSRRPARAQDEDDINVVPQSSYLGFLERFRWRPGGKGVRYKPKAADLQENLGRGPGGRPRSALAGLAEERRPDTTESGSRKKAGHIRQRSDTVTSNASKSTTNSLSSRGDLIMSDEEDDAIPLDDEFATVLTRQITNGNRRPGISRKSTRTVSDRSDRSSNSRRSDGSTTQVPQVSRLNREYSEGQELLISSHRTGETESKVAVDTVDGQIHHNLRTAVDDKDPGLLGDEIPSDVAADADQVRETKPMSQRPTRPASMLPSLSHEYLADSSTEPFPSLPTSPLVEERYRLEPP